MEQGRWVLLYTECEMGTNQHDSLESNVVIGLEAQDRDSAILEGSARWDKRLSNGTYQVARCCYDKEAGYIPFVEVLTYPRNPRLRLEVEMADEFADPLKAPSTGQKLGFNPKVHGFTGKIISA